MKSCTKLLWVGVLCLGLPLGVLGDEVRTALVGEVVEQMIPNTGVMGPREVVSGIYYWGGDEVVSEGQMLRRWVAVKAGNYQLGGETWEVRSPTVRAELPAGEDCYAQWKLALSMEGADVYGGYRLRLNLTVPQITETEVLEVPQIWYSSGSREGRAYWSKVEAGGLGEWFVNWPLSVKYPIQVVALLPVRLKAAECANKGEIVIRGVDRNPRDFFGVSSTEMIVVSNELVLTQPHNPQPLPELVKEVSAVTEGENKVESRTWLSRMELWGLGAWLLIMVGFGVWKWRRRK